MTAAAVAGSNEEGVEVASEFARYSLRRGRSITDLQYSRRSLLHGCSFAAVYCTCACVRARTCLCAFTCICLLLGRRHAANGEWKRFVAEKGRVEVAGRRRKRLREGTVGGWAAGWYGIRQIRRWFSIRCRPYVAFESRESPLQNSLFFLLNLRVYFTDYSRKLKGT